MTDDEGHYVLTYLRDMKGAVLGKHRVSISTQSEFFPKEKVPSGYFRKGALAANVVAGTNSIDFQLDSKFKGN